MQRARSFLITLIIVAIAARMVWDTVAPLIPYSVVCLLLIVIIGALFYRRRPW
jgi:hypothetical protein